MAQKKSGAGMGTAVAVGTSMVALASAAFLLFGPEGKKHRKDLKGWMVKMKADVMEKMEQAQELTGPAYEAIVAEVAEKYKSMKHIDAADIEKEVADLKKNWRALQKAAKDKMKKPAAKKAPAKTAKKAKK